MASAASATSGNAFDSCQCTKPYSPSFARASAGVRVACLLLCALAWHALPARIITVGTGPGCDFSVIQYALDFVADTNFDPDLVDEVRIMYYQGPGGLSPDGYPWHQESLSIVVPAGKDLTITGGYGSCGQVVSDGTTTYIDGHKGYDNTLGRVLTIDAPAGTTVHLRRLGLGGGRTDSGSYGGTLLLYDGGSLDVSNCDVNSGEAGYGAGIAFGGNGNMTLTSTTVHLNAASGVGGGLFSDGDGIISLVASSILNNSAYSGGGIYASATGTNAELTLDAGTVVGGNTAGSNGGGIWANGTVLTVQGANTIIDNNHADNGSGGGIYLTNHDSLDGYVYVTTAGVSGLGPIYLNTAYNGGGIALVSQDDPNESDLHFSMFSPDAAHPTRLLSNTAWHRGGAIFAKDYTGVTRLDHALLQIGNHIEVTDNAAPDGAAIFLEEDSNFGDAVGPFMDIGASLIEGNYSVDAANKPTNGAIIHSQSPLGFYINRARISGNVGGPVVRVDSSASYNAGTFKNMLIVDNTVTGSVVEGTTDLLQDSTIANNVFTAAPVLSLSGDTTLRRLIISQPGKTALSHGGGSLTVQRVMSKYDVASLGGPSVDAFSGDPLFVNAAIGDYHLQQWSPAVDYAEADANENQDLESKLRDVNLAPKANTFGPRDLGAFELQSASCGAADTIFCNSFE
jgi:hypothetical protein